MNVTPKKRKAARKRLSPKRRPINLLASLFTTMNLYCGVMSIFASVDGRFAHAAYWILGGIVFDMVDGTVARMTKSVSEFGKQLDSIGDIVSFGVAPAILVYIGYVDGETSGGPVGSMIVTLYVIFGALRLARYNTYQSDRSDIFIGLPIPGAAATIAALVLFLEYFELDFVWWVLCLATTGLSFLMVSSIEYPKQNMKAFLIAPKAAFRYLVFFAAGIAIFHYARQYHPSIVLFPLAATYVCYGIGQEIYRKTRRPKASKSEARPADSSSSDALPDSQA